MDFSVIACNAMGNMCQWEGREESTGQWEEASCSLFHSLFTLSPFFCHGSHCLWQRRELFLIRGQDLW